MKRYVFLLLVSFVWYFSYRTKPVDLSQYQSAYKVIEVKGEVQYPGIYEVAYDASIEDVLQEAGGVLNSGDTSHLNLTTNIENHGVIVVKKASEPKKISINTATAEELDQLSGIGPAIAKRIIEHRQSHPFSSLEELMEVKGIGEKLFAKIKDEICL